MFVSKALLNWVECRVIKRTEAFKLESCQGSISRPGHLLGNKWKFRVSCCPKFKFCVEKHQGKPSSNLAMQCNLKV